MPNRVKNDQTKNTSTSLQSGLLDVKDQIEKARVLLEERHGKSGTEDLAEKFRLKHEMGSYTCPEDIDVKNWFFETTALLDTILGKSDQMTKRFKKIEKDRTTDDPYFIGAQFSTGESGDILRDGINQLEKVVGYLEPSIKILDSQRNFSNSGNKYSIFISHINENRETAETLKKHILDNFPEKVDIFISSDPENISVADDWFEKIKNGIQKCNLMIILCTPNSIKSPWINFEAGAATILNKKIGPFCFEGQSVSQLPPPLNSIRSQAIDCSDEQSFKKHFDNLLKNIAENTGISVPDSNVLDSNFYHEIIRNPAVPDKQNTIKENNPKVNEEKVIKIVKHQGQTIFYPTFRIITDERDFFNRGYNIESFFIMKELKNNQDNPNTPKNYLKKLVHDPDQILKQYLDEIRKLSDEYDLYTKRLEMINQNIFEQKKTVWPEFLKLCDNLNQPKTKFPNDSDYLSIFALTIADATLQGGHKYHMGEFYCQHRKELRSYILSSQLKESVRNYSLLRDNFMTYSSEFLNLLTNLFHEWQRNYYLEESELQDRFGL